MEDDTATLLLSLWDLNICPQCGKIIPEGDRIGSGRRAEGGFCSLDCYTRFYQTEIIERAKKVQQRFDSVRN